VKLSFFGRIGFGRVGAPELTDDKLIQVASVGDIFATKLKVLLQRVEVKDYLDIYALLQAGASLEHALGAAQSLYGSAFQPQEALRALTYYDEGDLSQLMPTMRRYLERRVADCGTIEHVPIISQALSALEDDDLLSAERRRAIRLDLENGA
jgi:hypothetical protein